MSPVLSSVYVIEMLKDLEEKRLGIEVEGIWCGGLQYGNDIGLLERDQVELQVMYVVGKYARSRNLSSIAMWKYLGVWFDRGMRGNVHLEKMREKADKWGERIGCMCRVNGEMKVDRGRLIRKLLARPCMEHACEAWWTG